ncbi:hypothetical protein [Methylosinus sp. KRF6]|uniref:hypothetical protein n=1 Tax=Methylosinus sp. KRF6 TaxID=2846853 RepID=UPI001C0E7773|nr:hypothetical protein [Methylosinus sp. KRF6]MBU3887965.1 hypothetical protein [Methylosinus sp. KRF6]
MQLTAETAKAYVARVMASSDSCVRLGIDDEVASLEGGAVLKETGRAFYGDGTSSGFDWDVWRLEDDELYGEW